MQGPSMPSSTGPLKVLSPGAASSRATTGQNRASRGNGMDWEAEAAELAEEEASLDVSTPLLSWLQKC